MKQGILFDIQRFGLRDGPGIRTVIFFKGCPLRCAWCHNPESQVRHPQIRFRREACVLCGACTLACDHAAHQVSEDSHLYKREVCTACGKCVNECLYGALQMTGRAHTTAEVMEIVRRDRVYYATSGGGITLTGGEPLAQPDFCEEILSAARQEGIHTCVETCGYSSRRVFERMLEKIDLLLFDYKATGEKPHRSLTGAGNRLILENLDLAARRGVPIWLRCPLVPGVNDSSDHLRGLAALAARYPQLQRIELLPYHNVGYAKYTEYGLANSLPDLPFTLDVVKEGWLTVLRELGCQKAVLG